MFGCSCLSDVAHQVEALHELQGVLSLGSLCPPSLAQASYYTLALLHVTIRDYHQVNKHTLARKAVATTVVYSVMVQS